jgi:hypothetical protein
MTMQLHEIGTMRSLILKAYVIVVDAAALATLLVLPFTGQGQRFGAFLLLIALAAMVGTRSIRIQGLRMQLSPLDLFILCALMTVAPVAGPLVALAGVGGSLVGPNRRPFSLRTAFNLGALPLSASAAAVVFTGLGGAAGDSPTLLVTPILSASLAFLVCNATLVAIAVALETPERLDGMWARAFCWNAVACLSSMVTALGVAEFGDALGYGALSLGLFPAIPTLAYFRMNRSKVEGRDVIADSPEVALTAG